MPIQEYKPANLHDELMWTFFHNTSLISIDNVAFVVSNLNRITNLDKTLSMWCRSQSIPHVKFALSIIENVTMYLENYWNKSKRVLEWTLLSSQWKVDHIAIPNFQDEVKQTIGFVFYR
ncbi:aminopeptidase n [Lasius niger]|uniref:Aminopeptidase n n=1 Tax=Lasius niger TaxID=67767 RepID=A0A0J7MVD2_LASNI|nr:aminopeptidase n [Lasius niger]